MVSFLSDNLYIIYIVGKLIKVNNSVVLSFFSLAKSKVTKVPLALCLTFLACVRFPNNNYVICGLYNFHVTINRDLVEM